MSALLFQEIIRLEKRFGVVLCRSTTQSGEKFFHYIMANRGSIEQMHRDYSAGKHVDFATYGKIVYSGWGENPSAEEEEMIRQKFPKN